MTIPPQPRRLAAADRYASEPLELTADLMIETDPAFDHGQWAESQSRPGGAGGRQVLGWALALLAALWLAYAAWSAGRTLAGQPLASPAVAQWVAIAAGPLALLGLIWLMFGRTRRKEAERFTRSVVPMRSEARSLEALLEVLSQRIDDSQRRLSAMAERLMDLGDQATGKLGGITRDFDVSSERLARHGEALDRAAESARNDIGVLLDDLPRAEETARLLAEQIARHRQRPRPRGHSNSASRSAAVGKRARSRREPGASEPAPRPSGSPRSNRPASSAAARVDEAEASLSGALDALLERTSVTLDRNPRRDRRPGRRRSRPWSSKPRPGSARAGAESAETLAATSTAPTVVAR